MDMFRNRNTALYILFYCLLSASVCVVLAIMVLYARDFSFHIGGALDTDKLTSLGGVLSAAIAFFSLIVSFFLLLIAIKAYENFDVKKQLLNKQLDVVADLSKSLSETMVEISLRITMPEQAQILSGGYTHAITTMRLPLITAATVDYNRYQNMVVWGRHMEKILPFLKYRMNPLLPKDIAIAVKKLYRPLEYMIGTPQTTLKNIDYVILSSSDIPTKEEMEDAFSYEYYSNPSELNSDVRNLRESIVLWLKKYGAKDINL